MLCVPPFETEIRSWSVGSASEGHWGRREDYKSRICLCQQCKILILKQTITFMWQISHGVLGMCGLEEEAGIVPQSQKQISGTMTCVRL